MVKKFEIGRTYRLKRNCENNVILSDKFWANKSIFDEFTVIQLCWKDPWSYDSKIVNKEYAPYFEEINSKIETTENKLWAISEEDKKRYSNPYDISKFN